MKLSPTPLPGAHQIDIEELRDDRGFFARTFCADIFTENALRPVTAQTSIAYNARKGTLRGLHYQAGASAEAKLVRCTAGAIWDVIVDLRPGSPTYLQHFATELSAANRRALYVPEMFAHGYVTLRDDTEVSYAMSAFHDPAAGRGYRYDDPAFGIDWPLPVTVISERDRSWPSFGGSA